MTFKLAYQCDHAGLFVGTTQADESPLERGVYHTPAGCTLTPPPDEWPETKWPRWTGRRWDLVNRPQPPAEPSAAEKMAAFLRDNPDVAAMINAVPNTATPAEIPQEESTD